MFAQKEVAIETPNPAAEADSDAPTRKWLPEVTLAVGLVTMTIIVGRMIYHDSFVDGSTYSNRSFALPGAGFSLILVVYGCFRLSFLPLWLRVVGAPFAFFAGYLGIGLMLILINAAI
ncbi:MAG: hypothetical protein V4640_11950 [Verrucomicrobiota bacterium]